MQSLNDIPRLRIHKESIHREQKTIFPSPPHPPLTLTRCTTPPPTQHHLRATYSQLRRQLLRLRLEQCRTILILNNSSLLPFPFPLPLRIHHQPLPHRTNQLIHPLHLNSPPNNRRIP